nr:hypothetical protein GCM10025730_24710 [Promicromonospora thailandica]
MVDGEAPVGVAVERDAEVRLGRHDDGLELLRVGGAALLVDVPAVGAGVHHHDVGARRAQRLGAHLAGRAVGAVQRDAQPFERTAVRGGADAVGEVPYVALRGGLAVGADPPDVGARGPLPLLAERGLDRVLDRVVELEPAAREELDAVVGHRVVRGGDHDPEVGLQLRHEVGQRGRGQHVEHHHVHTRRRQPRRDGAREELARRPGVPPDDGPGPRAQQLALRGQHPRCGDAQLQRQLRRDVLVGETPNPVGAEQPAHTASPQIVRVPP